MKEVEQLMSDLILNVIKNKDKGAFAELTTTGELSYHCERAKTGEWVTLEFDFSRNSEQLYDIQFAGGMIYLLDEEYKIHSVDVGDFKIPDVVVHKLNEYYYQEIFDENEYEISMQYDWDERI